MVFFGLVQLGIGSLCLLMFGFTILSFIIVANAHPAAAPALQPRQILFSVAMYVIGGGVLITLGIGSMLARRWARDLSLLVSIAWLIFGLMMTGFMAFVMPKFLPAGQGAPATFIVTCMIVFTALFGVVLPLALVLFYRSPNVRATCIALDPQPRWTEGVPLPLLGLSLWNAFNAITMLSCSTYAVVALGADMLTGAAAVAIYIAMAAICAYVAWGLCQRSIAAWWTGIAYGVLVALYCVFVFPRIDYKKLVAAMHMPQTPGMPDLSAMYSNAWFLAYLAVFWLAYFGYFVYCRRYLLTEV